MRLKKGDNVKVIAGKDRGKTGTVLKAYPASQKISIEGINMYKKRLRPKSQGQKGETVLVARPLSATNVMLVCPNCKIPTRLGGRVEGQRNVRYCIRCQATV